MLDNKGAVLVITNIVLISILVITALVVDVGVMVIRKATISSIADSASLAAAQELTGDSEDIVDMALEYCEQNNIDRSKVTVTVDEDNQAVEVEINEDVSTIFAKVIGIDRMYTKVKTKAIAGAVSEVHIGIRPVAVEQKSFDYGELVILKYNDDSYCGNYDAIALGGNGASSYKDNIMYGYNGILKVGDVIDTETGNMTGPTKQGIDYVLRNDPSAIDNFTRNSLKLWTIPIVDSLAVNGRKSVTVVGFAEFFIEDSNSQGEIQGRFIQYVTNGKIGEGQIDYGAKGARLIGGDPNE